MVATNIQLSVHYKKLSQGKKILLKDNSLWLINKGIIKTYHINEEGKIIIFGYWKIQDVVGIPLSFTKSYYLEALTDSEFQIIDTKEYSQIMNSIIHSNQQMQRLTQILRIFPLSQKLYELLKWLGERFGTSVEKGTQLNIKLTHQEIADIIGTTRISISRNLQILEKHNLIERSKNKKIIVIHNNIKN